MKESQGGRALAHGLGEAEVLAAGELPGSVDDIRHPQPELAGEGVDSGGTCWGESLQAGLEQFRLKRAHGHALAIDGVEAAERIAHHHEASREAVQLLIVPAPR